MKTAEPHAATKMPLPQCHPKASFMGLPMELSLMILSHLLPSRKYISSRHGYNRCAIPLKLLRQHEENVVHGYIPLADSERIHNCANKTVHACRWDLKYLFKMKAYGATTFATNHYRPLRHDFEPWHPAIASVNRVLHAETSYLIYTNRTFQVELLRGWLNLKRRKYDLRRRDEDTELERALSPIHSIDVTVYGLQESELIENKAAFTRQSFQHLANLLTRSTSLRKLHVEFRKMDGTELQRAPSPVGGQDLLQWLIQPFWQLNRLTKVQVMFTLARQY
jgi:hypothetical protein